MEIKHNIISLRIFEKRDNVTFRKAGKYDSLQRMVGYKYLFSIYLQIHIVLFQFKTSILFPGHLTPLREGGGLSQNLLRCLVVLPQGFKGAVQLPHVPQLPSTKVK